MVKWLQLVVLVVQSVVKTMKPGDSLTSSIRVKLLGTVSYHFFYKIFQAVAFCCCFVVLYRFSVMRVHVQSMYAPTKSLNIPSRLGINYAI